MPGLRAFDHVGITVVDLDAAVRFFTDLGLEVEGRAAMAGEFVDTVIGVPGSRSEIVVVRPPGGGTGIELSAFSRPEPRPVLPAAMPTEPGLRNVCFEVEDLRGTVQRLAAAGHGLVGGVGEHEGRWLMAYVRGPEGVIVALAERLG